jgi:hypothetical protein
LVVTKLDRLARSISDLRAIADELTARQVRLSFGGQVYDPADPMGKLVFNMMSVNPPLSDLGSPITDCTVTASPGGATCTVTVPDTSCVVTGLTNGTPYTFTVTASNAAGSSVASSPSQPVTPVTGSKATPTAVVKCVVSSGLSIPRRGTRTLMKPKCVTTAGQRVGVKVKNVKLRGDLRLHTLYCQKPNGKSQRPTSTSVGAMCKTGKLRIRTYGYSLRMKIVWQTAAIDTFKAFKTVRVFKN